MAGRRTRSDRHEQEALARITDRYATDQMYLGAADAVGLVATAIRRYHDPEHVATVEADGDDALAALALLARVREQLNYTELQLLEHARGAGATWEQIGERLGYQATGAGPRAGGAGRFRTLARAHPWWLYAGRTPLIHGHCSHCTCDPAELGRAAACEPRGCRACLDGCPDGNGDAGCKKLIAHIRERRSWQAPDRDPEIPARFGLNQQGSGDTE